MAEIDCVIEHAPWAEAGLEALAERACGAALAHLGIDEAAAIVVLGCDDGRIAALNADFRGKPVPTNVLSWPAEDLSPEVPGAAPLSPEADATGALELGDIAIAYETCRREAEAAARTLADHATHLLVHGTLHLLGYDHVEDADAERMEALEVAILHKLDIADPYRG
ncbi:rRNA maturation RNase YbeY [Oceaniglobus roseus]|uniref:rRNA maturation RNase YbeY n=1 Tax=Oceaniglobus roseus TaxID=1737570 RepID=UPI000C7F78DD|nr:rRNA maturation RNase YbeY [Kandeliimicrobium roseum]